MESMFRLIRRFARRPRAGKVAILRLHGPISGGPRVADWIEGARRLRESDRVPAVVLEVDSPGGSAPASDMLFVALSRLAAEKPLVAYVGGVGASGGYLAALAAERLVVGPNSLIGSVGVISARPRLADLLGRVGIRIVETRAGRLKGLGAPWRDETPEEQAKERELVDAFYESFVARVAESRLVSPERARELATGEVWLGSRAVELGLADELGDLERAVEVAARMAGVPPRSVAVRVRRPLLARLADRFATRVASRLADAVEAELWGRGPRY
jgi:protease IV